MGKRKKNIRVIQCCNNVNNKAMSQFTKFMHDKCKISLDPTSSRWGFLSVLLTVSLFLNKICILVGSSKIRLERTKGILEVFKIKFLVNEKLITANHVHTRDIGDQKTFIYGDAVKDYLIEKISHNENIYILVNDDFEYNHNNRLEEKGFPYIPNQKPIPCVLAR